MKLKLKYKVSPQSFFPTVMIQSRNSATKSQAQSYNSKRLIANIKIIFKCTVSTHEIINPS